MENTYVQGFIDKCAEHGVDPEWLVKTSAITGASIEKLLAKMMDSSGRYTGKASMRDLSRLELMASKVKDPTGVTGSILQGRGPKKSNIKV